jgi:transposase
MLLSDNIERKISLAFLLKDLFIKDNIFPVYDDELSSILKSFNSEDIPENYVELVNQNLNKKSKNKIKFDNEILHRSKVIKHFLDENQKISRTEKDFKLVYKKIKRNKKYFISIKDIVVLDSLAADGISLPEDLDYSTLSSELTVPNNLYNLASQNQIGLVMLKIVEIIGEDNISDLDPETIYFLNKILNELNLKKIRNNILSEALPART